MTLSIFRSRFPASRIHSYEVSVASFWKGVRESQEARSYLATPLGRLGHWFFDQGLSAGSRRIQSASLDRKALLSALREPDRQDCDRQARQLALELGLPAAIHDDFQSVVKTVLVHCARHQHSIRTIDARFSYDLQETMGRDLWDAFGLRKPELPVVHFALDWRKARQDWFDLFQDFILSGQHYPIFGGNGPDQDDGSVRIPETRFLDVLGLGPGDPVARNLIQALTDRDDSRAGGSFPDCMPEMLELFEAMDFVLQQGNPENFGLYLNG